MSVNSTSKQTLAEAFRKSGRKIATPRLVASISLGTIGLVARSTSFAKNYDVSCRAGARPLIARRKATNAFAMGLGALGLAAASYQIAVRQGDDTEQYDPSVADNSELLTKVLACGFLVPIAIRELKTGTTLIKKHPISGYGRTMTTAAFVIMIADGVVAARELHNRRDDWMPELQELWASLTYEFSDAKHTLVSWLQDGRHDSPALDRIFEEFEHRMSQDPEVQRLLKQMEDDLYEPQKG